jgi:hypothetical protein
MLGSLKSGKTFTNSWPSKTPRCGRDAIDPFVTVTNVETDLHRVLYGNLPIDRLPEKIINRQYVKVNVFVIKSCYKSPIMSVFERISHRSPAIIDIKDRMVSRLTWVARQSASCYVGVDGVEH